MRDAAEAEHDLGAVDGVDVEVDRDPRASGGGEPVEHRQPGLAQLVGGEGLDTHSATLSKSSSSPAAELLDLECTRGGLAGEKRSVLVRYRPAPVEVSTDEAGPCLRVLDDLVPAAAQITEQYGISRSKAIMLSCRVRPVRGQEHFRSAARIAAGTRSCGTSTAGVAGSGRSHSTTHVPYADVPDGRMSAGRSAAATMLLASGVRW